MSTIPTSVTEEQFEQYIRPYLITAKRGYECKIALYKVFNSILKRLYTGYQWKELPIRTGIVAANRHDAFNLKANLQAAFKSIKRIGIRLAGTFFNADSAFDTREI